MSPRVNNNIVLLLGSPLNTGNREEVVSACTCTDYVNKNGVGNCKKGETRFNNEDVCYVSLPSTCPDLKKSQTDSSKFLSAVACQTRSDKTNSFLGWINPRISGSA